jgi:hypothetical protein
MEEWRELHQSPDYMISSYGRMKSLKRGKERILKGRRTPDGYIHYAIWINGKAHEIKAHRAVAEHFIPNVYNKPTVNHKDGRKDNNAVYNLEWATLNEQMKHAYRLGLKKPIRGTMHKMSILTEEDVKEIRRIYKGHDSEYGMKALAIRYGVSEAVINRVAHYRSYKNV